MTLKDKEPAAKGAPSPSLTSYLGTDTSASPSTTASASPSPSPSVSPSSSPSPGASPSPSPNPSPSIIPLVLAVDVLPQPGEQYTGLLLLTAEGSYPPLTWKINIKPASGVLVVDLPAISQTLTFWPWFAQSDCININIREKTGRVPLNGVSASLVQIVKSPGQGFDLNRNVDFSFNDVKVPHFTESPSDQPDSSNRSIAANNGMATIGLHLHGLRAGEYSVVIRFQSANSSNDDAKLILNLQVRHHWIWPLLALLAAVIVSFVLTKIVNSRRQRIKFMNRIEGLEPAWLNEEPQLLPVVWAQAILKQSQELSKRFWLTGEEEIESS